MANSTTNTQETRQFPLPSIKISYSGSGVRFLRILGWVNIGIFCLMGILLLFGAIDLFGFAGLGIFGLVVLISFPTLLLFAGVCFALATIAENALMSKAVLESKYDFREGDGGGYTTILDVEREAKAKYVAGKFSGECLPRDPKTRNN